MSDYRGFVRTKHRTYLVQRPAENQWGFELCDDETAWPGGFGWSEWTAVGIDKVPREIRRRLWPLLGRPGECP